MSKKDTVALVKANMTGFATAEKGSGVKITNKLAEEAYDAVIDAVKQEIVEKGLSKISGLGNFGVAQLNAGTKRNPKTGESVTVEARKTVRFAVSKVFRNTAAVQNAQVADETSEDAE